MLGEWYLPPGACQVISTITEGTISFSRPPFIIHLNQDYPKHRVPKHITAKPAKTNLPPDQEF